VISGNPARSAAIDGVIVYPNPASAFVRFTYDLAADSDISIRFFGPDGSLVSEIHESKAKGSGVKTVWDATRKAPGSYFALIEIKSAQGTRKYKKQVFVQR
jgi:hypothetical protein